MSEEFARRAPREQAASHLNRPLDVLIVDDDLALRDALLGALDSFRFHLRLAEGVPSAARLAARYHVDVVACGRMETAAALYERLSLARLRFVVFSDEGASDPQRRIEVVTPARFAATLLQLEL